MNNEPLTDVLDEQEAIRIVRSILRVGMPLPINDCVQEAHIAYIEARNDPEHGNDRVFVIGKVRTRVRDVARREAAYKKRVSESINPESATWEAPEPDTIVTPENYRRLLDMIEHADAKTRLIVQGFLQGKTFVQMERELSPLSRQTISRRLNKFITSNKVIN